MLKSSFPRAADGRLPLREGFVVCLFTNEPGQAADPAAAQESHPADAFTQCWWHVGLLYQNPWFLTFSILQRVASEDDSGDPRHPDRVTLQVRVGDRF